MSVRFPPAFCPTNRAEPGGSAGGEVSVTWKTIRDWPPSDRPRERLLAADHDGLTDAELLAVLLRTGTRDYSALVLGHRLLSEFGSMRGVLDAPTRTLLDGEGLGPTKVASLKAILPITARYAACGLMQRCGFSGSQDAALFLRAEFAGLEREVFACLFLDTRHRLLKFEKLFLGSVDRANVYPREIIKRALYCNAAAVIFAHNHPSGIAEPSAADVELTERLVSILKELDVRVLDHLVVGEDRTVSMAERGLM